MAQWPITPGMERTAYELEPVLQAAARTLQACLGFGTVVVNLHRAAWDDFETVVVVGSDEASDVLHDIGKLGVADAETMTADRAYRAALCHDVAQQELRDGSGTQFDPQVVEAFLTVLTHDRKTRGRIGVRVA